MRLNKVWFFLVVSEFEAPYPLRFQGYALESVLVCRPLAELELGAIVNSLPLEGILEAVFFKKSSLDCDLLDENGTSLLLVNLLIEVSCKLVNIYEAGFCPFVKTVCKVFKSYNHLVLGHWSEAVETLIKELVFLQLSQALMSLG